jgi:small subunit ribosomal protein S5
VGYGQGKALEVPSAIKKALEAAKKSMIKIPIIEHTIPHEITERFGAAKVLLKPAREGTGVIAGGAVRAVVEAAGIRDVVTKSLGSDNKINIVKATFRCLQCLQDPYEYAQARKRDIREATQ